MSQMQPEKLMPRAKRLLRLMASGYTMTDAANMCGYTLTRACILAHSTIGQEYIAMIEKDVNAAFVEEVANVDLDVRKVALDRIREEIPESVDRMFQLRDNAPPNVMFAATKHLLDIAGVRPVEEKQGSQIILADAGMLEAVQRLVGQAKTAVPDPSTTQNFQEPDPEIPVPSDEVKP